MNSKENELMEKHHITCIEKKVFKYKNFKYDSLEHAVKYAEIESSKNLVDSETEIKK